MHGHEYLEVLQLKGVRVSFKSIFDNELQKDDNQGLLELGEVDLDLGGLGLRFTSLPRQLVDSK